MHLVEHSSIAFMCGSLTSKIENLYYKCFKFRLGGLAFMFSASFLLQILACALYNNWWPMLTALMYVLVPMPCLFFGGGSTHFLTSREGGGWINAAKFLTGASAMGSIAIPAILRHAHLIETGAMLIEFTSFFILVCTVLCFHRVSLDEDW
ncbi:hypothetical protein IEQ34_017518 [Dendrobium chrysotoxum]|uniref:Vacuolar protein sorting-associated protein 55 homolog n=1 Tax=Dendrobium chrysotoxum TaxID=161865 RepID=A0AAV7FU82_DENCH|nr:hypothetical protein IEQ34_017518 [Dendrobium chrysotoxum]